MRSGSIHSFESVSKAWLKPLNDSGNGDIVSACVGERQFAGAGSGAKFPEGVFFDIEVCETAGRHGAVERCTYVVEADRLLTVHADDVEARAPLPSWTVSDPSLAKIIFAGTRLYLPRPVLSPQESASA